jgi:cytochrome c oxidase subunit 2
MIGLMRSAASMRSATTRTVCTLALAFAFAFASGCKDETAYHQQSASAEQLWQLCASCHGDAGEGKVEVNAPTIAGLNRWYIETQLEKFRKGLRGNHFDDVQGMQMRPMAVSLTEADRATIAAYVSSMPRQATAASLEGGDPARGQALYAPCAACHGQKAEGNEQLKAPLLAGTDDWYLYRQLEHFKAGVRGANPEDIEGGQMRPMAQTLTTPQAIKDVLAYIGTLR